MGQVHLPVFVALNGPPGCGKDTSFQILHEALNCQMTPVMQEQLSGPMKAGVPALFGVHPGMFTDPNRNRNAKVAQLFDHTPREVQIKIGEWMKSEFGEDVWGVMMRERIWQAWGAAKQRERIVGDITPVFVITDVGFDVDLIPLAKSLGTRASRMLLVHMVREGCTFDDDSRDYINITRDEFTCCPVEYVDANTVEELQAQIVPIVQSHITGVQVDDRLAAKVTD